MLAYSPFEGACLLPGFMDFSYLLDLDKVWTFPGQSTQELNMF